MHDGISYGETSSTYSQGVRLKRDPDKRFWGIISSTVGIYDKYKNGEYSEEDYKKCLEANSKGADMTSEELNAFIEKLSQPVETNEDDSQISIETSEPQK